MAHSKSFFGLRQGSTKTLTFSVYNGKQVTKDRVTVVKNPRSSLQMKQRAIMATAMRAYSAMKEICDHSNESLSYGQKTMNWFISKNANLLRKDAPQISLSVKDGFAVPNKYIISEGSLTCPQFQTAENNFEFYVKTASPTKLSELWACFGAPNVGDMVTLLILQQDAPMGNSAFYWVRFKHLEGDDKKVIQLGALEAKKSIFSLIAAGNYETNIDNFSVEDIQFNVYYEGGHTTFALTMPNSSAGLIASHKTDAGWLRSTSYMAKVASNNYVEAIATFPTNGEKILNGGNV